MPAGITFRHQGASADLTLWGDGTATLSSLYSVTPRKGYAHTLLERITDYADENSLVLVLVVRRFGNPRGLDNEGLVRLYERHGFTIQAYVKGLAYMTRQIGATP